VAGEIPLKVLMTDDALDELIQGLRKAGKAAGMTEEEIEKMNQELTKVPEKTSKINKGFRDMVGAINPVKLGWAAIGAAIAAATVKTIQHIRVMEGYKRAVRQATDATGAELDRLTAKVKATADSNKKDFQDVLEAANNFAKQTNISMQKSLDLMQKGFAKGADVNGGFLAKLKEYPVQFKNAKLSTEQFVAFTIQEVKGGIYDDKLLDTINEMGLSLREMTKVQEDALKKPFGEKFAKEIKDGMDSGALSAIEALQRIGAQAEITALTVSQKQTLIADIFKGAGESAGGFDEILKNINAALKINVNELSALEQKELRVAKAQERFNKAFLTLTAGIKDAVVTLGLDLFEGALDMMGDLADTTERESRLIGEQQVQFNILFDTLERGNLSTENRKKLIGEINTKYGTYLPNLISEKDTLEDLKKAQEGANKAFEQRIILLAAEETLVDVQGKKLRNQIEALDLQKELTERQKAVEEAEVGSMQRAARSRDGIDDDLDGVEQKLRKTEAAIALNKKEQAELTEEYDKAIKAANELGLSLDNLSGSNEKVTKTAREFKEVMEDEIGEFDLSELDASLAIQEKNNEKVRREKEALLDAIKKDEEEFTEFYEAEVDHRNELTKEAADKDVNVWKAYYEKLEILEQAAYDFVEQLGNLAFEESAYRREIELEDLRTQKDFELSLVGDNIYQREQIESQYAAKEKQLKRQAAQAEKNATLFDIAIEAAQKGFEIKAQAALLASNPITAPLAVNAYLQLGLMLGSAALEAGFVAARPLPAYAKGRKYGPAEKAMVAEDGPGCAA